MSNEKKEKTEKKAKSARKPWSKVEEDILRKHYQNTDKEDLLKTLSGRTLAAIHLKAQSMGLERAKMGLGKLWTKEEEDCLKKVWPNDSVEEILKAFPGRSFTAIKEHAQVLGLNRVAPLTDEAANTSANSAEKLPQEDPLIVVSERMKHLFGQDTLKPCQLPKMRAEKPFVIQPKSGEILIINSPLIGSLTAEDDGVDIAKNSLRLAEELKCDAVVLTGDLMYMLNQRYGTQRPYRTQISGVKVNPKKVQSAYPASVVNDPKFESIEQRLKKGEPVFMTLGLRLEHSIEMVNQTFTDKDGKPIYNGPVLITFGKLEDELIMFYANEFSRIGLFKTRAWAQKMVMAYTGEWRKEKDKEVKAQIHQKIKDFKEFLNIFATMSNISDESIDKAREIVTAYIIRKYEERIPNAKVISVGDSFLKLDSRSIMITTNKDSEGFRGKLSTMLAESTEGFSKGRHPGNIPNVMLGMGLNPFLDVKFVTYQASDAPKDKRMCAIIQLPMCIDAERYRDVIRNQNILKDLITRVGRRSGFESGVITFRWHESVATPIISFWASDLLKNKDIFKDKDSLRDLLTAKKDIHKLIYSRKRGCTHYGAGDIMLYDSPDDPNGRYKKYHNQVEMELLLAADAPIVMDQHDGDITQQANHDYQKDVHLNYLLPEDLLKKMSEIRNSKLSDAEKIKQFMQLSLEQKIIGGVLQPDHQIEGYVKSLEPYLAYFVKILQRSKKIKLAFKGYLSPIMHIMGNHCKNTYKTVGVFVSDAKHINEQLKEALLVYLIEHNLTHFKDDVRDGLTSPQNGPLGEARGCFAVEGHQRYTMVLKHKQGKMDTTQKNSQRRTLNENEVGAPIINLSGDDHKGGIRITRGIINIKTGGQQDEGSYGREIDGSEQNVFSIVYGLPVGGFKAGPTVFVILDAETMRRYALKPFPVDKKNLFRNSVE